MLNDTFAAATRHLARFTLTVLLLPPFAFILTQSALGQEPLTLEQLRAARKELAHRPRRVIFNNDGCDCLYYPKGMPVTVGGFLARRTTGLVDSQVDTLAYCSISSGFSNFTHDTSVGTVLEHSASDFGINPTMRNIARDLIDQGTDCLAAMVEFAHEHDREIFWSMRMNDTHDVAHRPDQPYFLFPPLKQAHPEWLVGEPVERTPVGRWSSVDYARPEIRDLAFRFIEEVVDNYDVDGVELDFFRHLCYFASVARGGVASDEERQAITDLMRRIRTMTEQAGMRRGRPVLVSIRAPDSVDYSREIGLDIERWLAEDLVDQLVTTGYFRLNPWEYSVQLGHRYGVPVYPCLSDSRVKGETRFRRSSAASYRGRALNAWRAGANGIHLFNLFNPQSEVFRQVGDPQVLQSMDKLYFVTVRDGSPSKFLAGGQKHRHEPLLTPSYTKTIGNQSALTAHITIGDEVSDAEQQRSRKRFVLHLELPRLRSPEQVLVRFNGQSLSDGVLKDGWLDLPIPPHCMLQGENRIEIALNPSYRANEDAWNILWDGGSEPGRPWRRDSGSDRTEAEVVDGAIQIVDRGEESGDYLYWRIPWGASAEDKVVVEARAKVVSGSNYVIVSNGAGQERLGLRPDRIELWSQRSLRYAMNTTDAFHDYRIEFQGQDLQVFVDGQLRIDARGKFARRGTAGRNELAFGAANSPMVGDAVWQSVRARLDSLGCSDIVVTVETGSGTGSGFKY